MLKKAANGINGLFLIRRRFKSFIILSILILFILFIKFEIESEKEYDDLSLNVLDINSIGFEYKLIDICRPNFESDEIIDNINSNEKNLSKLQFSGIDFGGTRIPQCKYTSKVAIIIPFRNRSEQLSTFIVHYITVLKKQGIYFRIFVSEQSQHGPWNKGSLYNAGILEALKLDNFDCFILHDIDLLLINENLIYSCHFLPSHFSVASSQLNYKLTYDNLFGGVVVVKLIHLRKVNGFSNCYRLWGAEDDDFILRFKAENYSIFRPRVEQGRYLSNDVGHFHVVDFAAYTNNVRKLRYTSRVYKFDGLNTVRYKLIKTFEYPSFTRFLIHLSDYQNCENIYPFINTL